MSKPKHTAAAFDAYLDRFDTLGDAIAFEVQVISIGREFWPADAAAEIGRVEPADCYWNFLTSQHDRMEAAA